MNRNPTDGPANPTNGQKDSYSFGLTTGTVVSSTGNSGDRQFRRESIAPSDTSSPTARRLESELWRLVLTDKLTGLCNQQGFVALAEQQWRVSRRGNREMVFVGLELEGLQELRDRSPRGGADLALIAAARILTKTFRRSDLLCHWRGGEFRVLAIGGEGLEEIMLMARIQYQAGKTGAPCAAYPLVFNGRMARIRPQTADSFAGILARLNQEYAEFK
jgi:diguanylate cyclase (GGDEF)-like protein